MVVIKQKKVKYLMILICALLLGMQVNASNTTAAPTPANSLQQYANYVVLGQAPNGDNIAIARSIIDESVFCPSISVKDNSLKNSDSVKKLPMIPRDNPNHFSVIVCEALINFDTTYQVDFSDLSIDLPMAKSNPQNIQVFGDTGCALTKPGKKGCAKGTPAEPFKALADAAAREKPDLVLHMGDYNYRGTSGDVYFTQKNANGKLEQVKQWSYDAGDGSGPGQHCGQTAGTSFYSQSALNSNFPDIWDNWHDDVFKSGKELMSAAPWVVARGNHELCSRAGAGYFYFLDPHSNLLAGDQQLSCPVSDINKSPLDNTVQIPSYKVSFDGLDIVVIDSANACDSYADSPFTKRYQQVFKDVEKLVNEQSVISRSVINAAAIENSKTSVTNKPTWLMGHRPIWALTEYSSSESTACTSNNQYGCVNQMMQAAIKTLPDKSLPASIKLVLAGHMHRFQSLSFGNSSRPPQLVIGSSGVALSSNPPDGALSNDIDGLSAQLLSTNNKLKSHGIETDAFGYLRIELENSGEWNAKLVNPPQNIVIAECSSRQNKAQGVCEFAPNISVDSLVSH